MKTEEPKKESLNKQYNGVMEAIELVAARIKSVEMDGSLKAAIYTANLETAKLMLVEIMRSL